MKHSRLARSLTRSVSVTRHTFPRNYLQYRGGKEESFIYPRLWTLFLRTLPSNKVIVTTCRARPTLLLLFHGHAGLEAAITYKGQHLKDK